MSLARDHIRVWRRNESFVSLETMPQMILDRSGGPDGVPAPGVNGWALTPTNPRPDGAGAVERSEGRELGLLLNRRALGFARTAGILRRVLPTLAGATRIANHDASRPIRLAAAAAAGWGAYVFGVRTYAVATSPGSVQGTIAALAAFACGVPLVIWLVAVATERPLTGHERGGLVMLGAVVAAPIPFAGVQWVGTIGVLAGLVLAGLRLPWSAVGYGLLAPISSLLALMAFHQHSWSLYFAASMAFVSLPLATGIWLIRAARQLLAARLELAAQALVRERLRVDDELRTSVGAGLRHVAALADSAARGAGDPSRAERDLDSLIDVARGTLAEARQTVRRYGEVSARAELETAAMLLSAAGIEVRVAALPGELPNGLDADARHMLQQAVAELLSRRNERPTTIAVVPANGRLRIEIQQRGEPSAQEAAG